MPQGPGLVTRRRERTHQRSRDPRVERIERGEVAPPRDRSFVLAPCGRCRRQRLGRPAGALLQPRTLGIHPPLELGPLADEEPIEERPRVDPDRRFYIAALQRLLEGLHVAGEHSLIQPQLGRAEQQLVCVKIAPQRVAGLFEEGARVSGVALGPEVGHHLVAAQTDRKSTRLNSSHVRISYAVFCLKKKTSNTSDQDTVTEPSETVT